MPDAPDDPVPDDPATAVLAAVAAALTGLYPDAEVYTSKRRATDGDQGQNGFPAAFAAPCFIVSCNEPERIDAVGTFEFVSVGLAVTVEYVKSCNARVAGAANCGPPAVVEDPEVRAVRTAVRGALYTPTLVGAPAVYAVRHEPRPAYEHQHQTQALYVVSGEAFTYTLNVPRP